MKSDVITELYRVFSPYRLGDDFVGCSHCIAPEQSKFLATTPLDRLAIDDLNNYAFKAMTTWGDVNHFKHFLPRLFELVILNEIDAFDFPEVLLGKLDYGKWANWAPAERHSVRQCLQFVWHTELQREATHQDDYSIDTALCALGCACQNIDDFLQMWLERNGPAPVRQLAQFIWLNADTIVKINRLWNAYWNVRPSADEVIRWLRSHEVDTFLHQGKGLLLGHLAYSLGQLEAIRHR